MRARELRVSEEALPKVERELILEVDQIYFGCRDAEGVAHPSDEVRVWG